MSTEHFAEQSSRPRSRTTLRALAVFVAAGALIAPASSARASTSSPPIGPFDVQTTVNCRGNRAVSIVAKAKNKGGTATDYYYINPQNVGITGVQPRLGPGDTHSTTIPLSGLNFNPTAKSFWLEAWTTYYEGNTPYEVILWQNQSIRNTCIQPCPDVAFIGVSGSGQHYKSDSDLNVSPEIKRVFAGMTSVLGNSSSVRVQMLDYPARSVNILSRGLTSGSPWHRYEQFVGKNLPEYLAGKESGETALTRAVAGAHATCPGQKLVLAGYSQGAMVVHEFLTEVAPRMSKSVRSSIRGVVLVADPERVKREKGLDFGTAHPTGFGICDFASILRVTSCTYPEKLRDIPTQFRHVTTAVCNEDDIVCDTGDWFHDFAFNTPRGWKYALALGMTVHGNYRYDSKTALAGKRAARLLRR